MSSSPPEVPAARRDRLSLAAVLGGVVVLALTAVSQTGLLGPHDFVRVAALGSLGVLLSVLAIVRRTGRARRTAVLGLLLAAAPLILIGYYVVVTGG